MTICPTDSDQTTTESVGLIPVVSSQLTPLGIWRIWSDSDRIPSESLDLRNEFWINCTSFWMCNLFNKSNSNFRKSESHVFELFYESQIRFGFSKWLLQSVGVWRLDSEPNFICFRTPWVRLDSSQIQSDRLIFLLDFEKIPNEIRSKSTDSADNV